MLARLDPFRKTAEQSTRTGCPENEAERLALWRFRQEVFGHVGPPPDPDETLGLLATLTSTCGDVGLNVLRRGVEEPLILRPDWIDVVIASPAFLVLTLILTYLASILLAPDPPKEPTRRRTKPEQAPARSG